MNEILKEKLRHASSRKIILKDNTVVKFYPRFYGYIIHDIIRMLFYIVYGIYDISILSPRRRIFNEIRGRKFLGSIHVKTTEIKKFSLKNKYLEEKFEANAFTVDDIERIKTMKAAKLAKEIGRITRRLNDTHHYFIDNRASNWMWDKGLIRTDLELFGSKRRYRKFFMFCDILSFISTIQNEKIKEKFMEGYGEKIREFHSSIFLQLLVNLYIKITDIIF
jgi:tRNA A-37 threonylcarbamoyl transferase component Bud32